jgi:hypothetical protein
MHKGELKRKTLRAIIQELENQRRRIWKDAVTLSAVAVRTAKEGEVTLAPARDHELDCGHEDSSSA